jgi:hypothetical protein
MLGDGEHRVPQESHPDHREDQHETTHSLAARGEVEACLFKCLAVKNTCDTLRPVRKNCAGQEQICRHSCSHAKRSGSLPKMDLAMFSPEVSQLPADTPDGTTMAIRVSKRVETGSPVLPQQHAALPTDKADCVSACKLQEDKCLRDGWFADDCHMVRRGCDQSCFHSKSNTVALINRASKRQDAGTPVLSQQHATPPANRTPCLTGCDNMFNQCLRSKPTKYCYHNWRVCDDYCGSADRDTMETVATASGFPELQERDEQPATHLPSKEARCAALCTTKQTKCLKATSSIHTCRHVRDDCFESCARPNVDTLAFTTPESGLPQFGERDEHGREVPLNATATFSADVVHSGTPPPGVTRPATFSIALDKQASRPSDWSKCTVVASSRFQACTARTPGDLTSCRGELIRSYDKCYDSPAPDNATIAHGRVPEPSDKNIRMPVNFYPEEK